MKYKVTYGKNVYNKEEILSVNKAISKSTQMGKNVLSFENKISKLVNKNYTVMCNSASSAFLILAEILDLKKGDEFIVPALNFPTAIVPFLKKGLIPKIVDINIENLQIDLNSLKKNLTKKTKFALIPNLVGNVPRWDLIKKIVGNKIILVEDSADTIGPKINNKLVGNYSDFTITSFYGSHIISCAGNGGALSLNKKKDYLRARILRSWGRYSSIISESDFKRRFNFKINNKIYDKKFVFIEQGYNLEPSELGAAFGLVQLKKLNKNIKKRIFNYYLLRKYFLKYKNYFNIIDNNSKNISTALLAFPIVLKKKIPFTRHKLQIFLEKNKIQTRPIFSGNFLLQPAFKKTKFKSLLKKFDNSDHVTDNGLMFGLHQGLNVQKINYIKKTFQKFLKKYLKSN